MSCSYQCSREVQEMCSVTKGARHDPAPIPEEGKWVKSKEIKDISGLTHGVGACAPQQGTCKLTLNVKEGVIREALVETIGCSGMTHSDGLPVGAGLEDLGKGLRSQVGTMYSTEPKGVRYLEMAEGYVLAEGLDANNEVIGYKTVNLGKMMEAIRNGTDPKTAFEKNVSTKGRFDEAVKVIDPRKE